MFVTTNGLKAQPNLIVEHYTVEQGLSNNIVNCTLKGKDGFVWFGTWYGLCSFDGAKFKTYNNREGTYSDLPPRKIQRIVEDKNGALWIKTIEHKLYIFNKNTESFYAVSDDMKEYSENIQIIKIEGTYDGKVLLLTRDKSLLRACTSEKGEVDIKLLHDSRPHINIHDYELKYNIFSESQEFINWIGMDYKIISYRKGEELLGRPADFITGKLAADETGTYTCAYGDEKMLWLGDKNGKVYSVDPQTGAVNRYDIPGVSGAIVNLLVSDAGLIYLSVAGKGIYEYNPAYGQVNSLSLPVSPDHIYHSFTDRHEKIWFQEGEQAIIYYDPLNRSSKRFAFPEGASIGNFEMQDAGEQGLFFLTPAGEMLWFDRETITVTRMNQLNLFTDENRDEHFFHQMLDEEGILRLSSTSLGVYKVNFPRKQFRLFDPHIYSTNRRNESTQGIRALYQTKNGDIWIGTRWQETYRLDRNGELRKVFSADNYPIGNVYHITEDSRGNIWFATKGNELVKAEPDINSPLRFKFTRYVNDPDMPSTISGNDIYFTFEDSKGVWAGSFGGGLNLMNVEDGRVVFHHKHNTFRNYPPYGLYMEIRNITEDEEGRIWVGTTDGLMSFDGNFESPEEISFETFRQESAVLNMADNDIYVLYKDASSDIWVSVFGGGLNKLLGYDKKTGKPLFKSYGLREGLNNDVVMSIMEDHEGNLWFATEGGLSRFDSKTEHFRNYDKYDGFFNVDMEESSSMRTVDGEMWLGTKQGVLIFSPEKLETSTYNYPTYIVDFKISNRDINSFEGDPILDTSIKYTDHITLNHRQSMFTIEFAALNYLNQNRVSYRYILDGYKKEWHYNGKNRIASYTNVPPGSYLFYVQAMDEANPDWVSEQTLRVTILPPGGLPWWAYMIYDILALILMFIALRLAFFMIKMKNDVYIEQKLSELKIQFFINISHEIRTPITLIID
ncbi:MAG: hybrid sensor histidine kinase/response regulator, partial [Bacteroides sp.]|nr:hybrid sensor histidine kinase/response regulator [Bacteroides sp.]